MAAALVEVAEGRIPQDRIALRELHREMLVWPFLEDQPSSTGSEQTQRQCAAVPRPGAGCIGGGRTNPHTSALPPPLLPEGGR